ncbi:XRE family transcriptional regulator [Galbitalea sp. SE-J8]|uniref:XRE family transcriptional regulator n=1 Tax=Galbitalea sp. SE-J8 TaxID=3054952 RepID=UPI00259CD3D9|nr:XRE family transcriptional regulator [Galbitalea sp. SE-J8]MDM4764428.1 XRE family transcriptional regulator [Galbitalea sp. SE-J8]
MPRRRDRCCRARRADGGRGACLPAPRDPRGTQKELADRMAITQPRISALEAGDLDRSGLATLTSYVEALCGTVEVTATFGNRKLVLSSDGSAEV